MQGARKGHESYKKLKTLGSGAFGTAYLVQAQTSGQHLVIKEIDIQQMDDAERRATLREAKILELLNHPNIIKFHEVYKTRRGKLCIVMEYADAGDLNQLIKDRRARLKEGDTTVFLQEDEIFDIFTQICLALNHVHEHRILHRDLKSHNIFLTKTKQIKLGDFGIAKVLTNTKSRAESIVGTPYYLSPEMCKSEKYDYPSDIWALGVLFFEMCALKVPFQGNSMNNLIMKIIRGRRADLPECYSKNVNNLVRAMLRPAPADRPNIGQIFGHPSIKASNERI